MLEKLSPTIELNVACRKYFSSNHILNVMLREKHVMFTYGRYVNSHILCSNNEKALTKLYKTSHKSYCKQDKLDSINAKQWVVIISDELLVIFYFLYYDHLFVCRRNK